MKALQVMLKSCISENAVLVRKAELKHSHKKQKDSLEGSLDRVLLAAKLEFPKILAPRLPQHISEYTVNVRESQNGQNNSVLYM